MEIYEIAIISTIYFLLSSACAILHAVGKDNARKCIKCLPIIVLIVPLIIKYPTNFLPYLGLIFGVIGDALLIPKKKICFVLGLFSFLAQHITLYIFLTTRNPEIFVSPLYYAIILIAFATVIFLFFKFARKVIGRFTSAAFSVYGCGLALNIFTSGFIAIFANQPLLLIFTLGYIIFTASDFFICTRQFKNLHIKYRDLLVIITYYPAQFLLFLYFILSCF